jgi:hypothetical protein
VAIWICFHEAENRKWKSQFSIFDFPFTTTTGLCLAETVRHMKKYHYILIIWIAVFLVVAVFLVRRMTTYSLTIHNKSSSVITDVIITAPGVQKQINSIRPGKQINLRLSFNGDGILQLEAKQNSVKITVLIEGYVTGSSSGDAVLVFENDGQYNLINQR